MHTRPTRVGTGVGVGRRAAHGGWKPVRKWSVAEHHVEGYRPARDRAILPRPHHSDRQSRERPGAALPSASMDRSALLSVVAEHWTDAGEDLPAWLPSRARQMLPRFSPGLYRR